MLLAALLILAACGGSASGSSTPAAGSTGAKLNVVATHSILGDLVRNVGGDLVEVRTLVGPGGDAHTFEASPSDGVALVEAALIFENGLAFEPWLDDLYVASGSGARRVVVTQGIELIPAEGAARAESGDEHAAEDEHGEFDPHVWHDVANTMKMVEAIRDALAAADATNAASYTANADTYLAELKDLDGFVAARSGSLPAERRKLVTSHDTFAYFARRYGYEVVGTALGSATTESADPSAGEIAALVEQIKVAGVPVIFAENIQNAGVTEQIAEEAGVELGPSLYTDALGQPGSDGDTYMKMVRYNVESIVTALGK
jgi:ABC-type Zn uptake system ZnuABC Zn-binding protein ZnuA